MEDYWLITYSQQSSSGGEPITANTISKINPAVWLLDMIKEFPDSNTILLSAIQVQLLPELAKEVGEYL